MAGSALAQQVPIPPPVSPETPLVGGVAGQTSSTGEPKALVIEEEDNDEGRNVSLEPAGSPTEDVPADNSASSIAGKVENEAAMPPLNPGFEGAENELEKALPDVVQEEPVSIQIHIEKINGKRVPAGAAPGAVQVSSPWPAKPLTEAPLGWKFVPAPVSIPPYRTAVQLDASHTVDLAITPYLLVPASDGRNAMTIKEPGYERHGGYFQKETLGAILETSTLEIERQEKNTAAAIERLQELLTSLPRP